MTTDAAFLAERGTGIGGSDVHHVFNLEPYGCSRLLWYQKRDVPPDYQRDDTVFRRGHLLEALVADEYCEATGRSVSVQTAAARHKDHPELLVHIDRWTTRPPAELFDGVLEIKTANREMFCKFKRDGLSQGYVLQLQHAMLVANATWGAFAVLWPDAWKLLHWDVEADAELQELIRSECVAWWARFKAGVEPDRLEARDRRCQRCVYRTSCQGAAMLEACGDEGGDVPTDPALADLAAQFLEMRDIRDEAEGQLDELKALIDKALAGRPVLDTSGARIYLRPQTSMRWDTRTLEKKHPELVGEFKKPSVSRPLRVFSK